MKAIDKIDGIRLVLLPFAIWWLIITPNTGFVRGLLVTLVLLQESYFILEKKVNQLRQETNDLSRGYDG